MEADAKRLRHGAFSLFTQLITVHIKVLMPLPDLDFFKSFSPDQLSVIQSIYKHASELLNNSPRFKYFTLHNHVHFDNLYKIADHIVAAGLRIENDDKFLLALAIPVHDLGMCVGLSGSTAQELLYGVDDYHDSANIENFVRKEHHNLVDDWIEANSVFLNGLSLPASTVAMLSQICKCHRVVPLETMSGIVKHVGSLLRVIDELDIGPNRAPRATYENVYKDLDPVAKWHWFKHNITDDWIKGHNVEYVKRDENNSIQFSVVVRPPRQESVEYWLNQSKRPIQKALHDSRAWIFIKERYGLSIDVKYDVEKSQPYCSDKSWEEKEFEALSAGKKVILFVDDEARKLSDLFYPLIGKYHVQYAYDANEALTKLAALDVDLAILDLQMPAQGAYTSEETGGFKATGLILHQSICEDYPKTKVGIFSGSRHDYEKPKLPTQFMLKKPIDPDVFVQYVEDALK